MNLLNAKKSIMHAPCWIITWSFWIAFISLADGSGLKTTDPVSTTATAISTNSQFQANDRWCAIGDSITHTGFYTRYIYLFYATRFPGRPIDFFNCGSAGDTAKGTVARLQKDILRHQPTVATIMLGMNDVRRGFYSSKSNAPDLLVQRDAAIDTNAANMKLLAEKLQAAGVRLIFITPSPFDDTVALSGDKYSGVNAALGRVSENTRKLAAEFKSPVIDFHAPMTAINLKQQKMDPKFTLIGPDRIHPKEVGGLVMAYLFLKAQGVPQFADDISEDAAGRNEVSFKHVAQALPFPVPTECMEALKLVPFMADLNQERLRVTHLPPGKYKLSIDGEPVAFYTAAELEQGVNLAIVTNTPEGRQARVVEKLDARRYELVQILRTLDFLDAGLNPNYGVTEDFDYAAALAKRKPSPNGWGQRLWTDYAKYKPQQAAVRQEKEDLAAQIRRASQPEAHVFDLKKE